MKTIKANAVIAYLERKLLEALAGQAHVYNFANATADKASTDHLLGSGVIMTLTVLGGRKIMEPVLFRDGLSAETIAAIKADLKRSFDSATM